MVFPASQRVSAEKRSRNRVGVDGAFPFCEISSAHYKNMISYDASALFTLKFFQGFILPFCKGMSNIDFS